MNKIRWCILITLNIQLVMMEEKPECTENVNKLETSLPEVKAVRKNTIEISWKHLIDDITLSCYDQIMLKDGDGEILASEDDMEKIRKKSFKHDSDICQESEVFVIDISSKHGDLPNIQTMSVKYSVPDF